ncbi:MAG: TetR/AcrR family transcriptional regulator [Thiogranum sp.]|nr:TetR/AcrR family transcriptional regulator [Thiogranum sp.]
MPSLRDKKFARTRLALAGALATALAEQSLADISVKRLCFEAEVSEATFFNYFPSKSDLMTYLAHLWLLELGWYMQQANARTRGLPAIDELFAHAAATCARKPGVFRELLVWIARGGKLDPALEISAIEKQLAFPGLAQIDQTPLKGIDAWLVAELQAAIAAETLPANALLPTLLAASVTILLGVPLTLLSSAPDKVAGMYRQQLALLWAGVQATAGYRA